MKRAVLPLLCGAGLCLAGVRAHADIDTYEVANLTASGGVLSIPYGPSDYPVQDDLTFSHLQLVETFSGGVVTDTILNGTATLDTSAFTIDTAQFDTTAHGGLLSATLTGTLSATAVNVYNQALPLTGTTPVTLNSSFTATLAGATAGSFINIDATDASSNSYAIGTLSLVNVGPSQATVPEPGTVGLLVATGAVSLLGLRRRARRA